MAFWVEIIGYFEGWNQAQIVLGYTKIVIQLLFSLFPSILTFYSDMILGLFLTFWGPNWLFLGSMWGSKTVLGYTHVVEQLSFSMIPLILTFEFKLILRME